MGFVLPILPTVMSKINMASLRNMWKHSVLMVSVLESELIGPSLGPSWGLDKTALTGNSHSASLHPGV